MTPDQFEKLNHLFHVAIEVEASERENFLKKVCRNDDEILNELERLIEAHEKAKDFIQTPAILNSEAGVSTEETSLIGQQFGVYKIISEIGRGGMGTVYLAERTDGEFEKKVAIKIIKRGMDTESVLRRFRNERQILASLEHPNIAHLLDGGTTADGLPYFVMEYIEGLPITEFAEANSVSINDRLELFRQVCSAITYSHQRLIVHRDIKPSNIIVTNDGVPKLLDFGIAKLMNPHGIGAETASTATGTRLMTLEYASPEQIQGLPVTTLSDVYSLGVVLYELLSGQSPYRFENLSLLEIAEIINAEEPAKPSERAIETKKEGEAETRKYGESENLPQRTTNPNPQLLKGDLDNIVLMALRKEPARRYASAEQFSDDIRRHLTDLPVIARPLSLMYRLAKFALRNKTAVALGIIIFLTLVGGIITTTWQAIRANIESGKSARRLTEAQRLANKVIFEYHDAIEDLPKREGLLRNTILQLENLANENDGGSGLNNLLASCHKKLGATLREKGELKEALQEYQKSSDRYEILLNQIGGDVFFFRIIHADTFYQKEQIFYELGDLQNAKKSYEKYLEIIGAFTSAERESDKNRRHFSDIYEQIGDMLIHFRENEQALANFNKSQTLLTEDLKTNPTDFEKRQPLIQSYAKLSRTFSKMGKFEEAMNQISQFNLLIEDTKLESNDASVNRFFIKTYMGLGETYNHLSTFQTISASEKDKLNKSSCQMYQKSSKLIPDLVKIKMVTKSDDETFKRLMLQLNKCDKIS